MILFSYILFAAPKLKQFQGTAKPGHAGADFNDGLDQFGAQEARSAAHRVSRFAGRIQDGAQLVLQQVHQAGDLDDQQHHRQPNDQEFESDDDDEHVSQRFGGSIGLKQEVDGGHQASQDEEPQHDEPDGKPA